VIGKRVRGALYVHRDGIALLAATHAQQLAHAVDLAGPAAWNVARLEPSVIALLCYDDFDADPFPALRASTRVDLASGQVATRDFSGAQNPLILHRKEQLVAPDHPHADDWRALTLALEARGLFREPHLIGRRDAWRHRLAEAGVRVENHHLCPI
jgi:DNA phosphorothioation-associated putative methyltransferase